MRIIRLSITKLLLAICLLQIRCIAAFSISYGNLVPVTMKNGLDNNTVYAIHHEGDGFVWLATDMGISRYDGFRIRNFPLILCRDSGLLPFVSCAVTSISQSPDGLLYLQLLQGGIACFDPQKEEYLPVSYDRPIKKQDILSFYIADEQNFYIGTTNGLYTGAAMRSKKRNEDGITIRLSEEPHVKGEVSNLSGRGKEALFACVDRTRVMIYDIKSAKADFLDRRQDNKITTLYQYGDYLWICPSYSDIELYNLKQKTFHQIQSTGTDRSLLQDTYITDIVCVDDVNYYVATWKGLFSLKFDSKELVDSACRFEYMEQSYPFRMEGKITDLLWHEEQQILWIATFGSGSYYMHCTAKTFNTLEQTFDAGVAGIEEDQWGHIWILTDKGKLWRSTSSGLSKRTVFVPWTKGLKQSEIYRMDEDKNGLLWLGDSHGGVVCISPTTEEVMTFTLAPEGTTDFSEAVHQFCVDSRNRLWIITTNELILFDSKSGKCRIVSVEYEGRKIKEINSIAEDKDGDIWLGTGVGLKRMENQGNTFKLIGEYERDAGLEVAPVYSIYVNSYNQILASCSDKILRIDGREKGKIENVFTLLNGLSSSHIFCMVDDENGNTWAGSNSGIVTIRNNESLLYNYASFGYSNEVCRLRDGRLLWASSLGLTFFDPMAIKAERNKNALRLAELWVNGSVASIGQVLNGQVVLKTTPDLQRNFVFGPGNDDFTFYFSDLEYGIMQHKQVYRLLPDEEWKNGALEDGISFRKLPVGKYTLQVKLVYPDASESELIEIPIRVKTYWWNTFWAKSGYLLLFVGGMYAVYCYIEHKGRRREMYKSREMELRENLNLTKMEQEQKQEIEVMRNQLLTKFMEELRTPLSLIIAPLKEVAQESGLPAGILSKLRVAYRNSLGMLDACNQLLAIYTQGSLTDKLKVAPYSIERLVDGVVVAVGELVRINQFNLRYDKKIKKDMEIWADNKRIRFVLHNLLSNAFNHVRFSGDVSLLLQEMVRDGVRYCVIVVEDNGKNRVKEASQFISEEIKSDLTDLELGYGVMEKIIQLHHGTIVMKSREGEGTEVIVELPMGKAALENDPNILFVEPEPQEESEEIPSVTEEPSQNVSVPDEAVVQVTPEAVSLVQKERKTLLIVEDHKDIRLYLKVLFYKEYDLLLATNGQEGVDIAVKEHPDLILCDVMMPVKDGFECCRELKEGLETCHIPFIMLTAKVEDDDIIRGLELGADDYILKPFTPGILKARVRNLINARVNLKQMYTNLLMTPDVAEGEAESEEKAKMEDPFICSVVKIIEENMAEADFSVKKLASELNMSQPTLYRKVKQSTDFTIIELIRGVRMRKAATLLKQKIYAVQEVVEIVGYNDIPTFRKHFVDTFGTTPSTYPDSEIS